MVTINSLIIPCTPSIATAYGSFGTMPGTCPLFDSSYNLILTVQPNSYKRITQGKIEIKRGFGSPTVLSPLRVTGFEATIADGRVEIEDIINALQNAAIADPTAINAITILDYVRPETADRYTTGYTIRQGIFTGIEPEAGTLMYNDTGYTGRRVSTGGLRLTFEEFDPRSLY